MINSLEKTLKKSTFFSFFLLVSFFSQAQVNLDSLWGVWNDETAPDSSRAKAMHKIAQDGYLYSQPDSAYYFGQMLYDFATKKGLRKEMAMAKRAQGISYFVRSDYPKALDYFQRSLTISKEISDKSGMAGSLNNIGVIYRNKGYYPKALDYYQRCLKILEEISDKRGMAYILNNIGVIYKNKGEYSKAMEYYQRSFNIMEELSDLRGMAVALDNIGVIYRKMGYYPKALDYYQRCLKIMEEISDKSGMASVLNNIGEVYMDQGGYSQAMDYYQRSLKIKEEISDKKGMVKTLNNIGRIYYQQGDHANAIYWCEKGLQTSDQINVLEGQKHACEYLYYAYKAIGNHDKALVYHERTIMLDDSLQMAEATKKLEQMEFARQVLADSLLNEEEKLKIQMTHEKEVRRKKLTRNVYVLSAVFLLVAAIGVHRRMVYNRRAQRALKKEKKRSDKLLLNILPIKIAEELKEKGRADAKKIEMVTILFSDFKEFSKISEKLSAKELVAEINICFESFDIICGKYGIEKIKTIGGSYMAAGGLPVPSVDSVKNTVLAGLEMAEFIVKRKEKRETEGDIGFEMRVGINTGSVVAGIVGITKFQYDIWGDAVNTASRIENSGEAGKLNISQPTYELIKEDPIFKFQSRGYVRVKSKGDIEMWFVEKAT